MTNKVKIGEIAKIVSGSTPSRRRSSFWGGNIPWVKTGNLNKDIINATDIDEYITSEALEKTSLKLIPAGTILMAMYGQGKTRGQVSILGIDATINQACAAFLLHDKVERDYFFQQLRYRYHEIRNLSNIGSQENLNADIIRNIKIPLPELAKQKAIAQILKAWDSAIEKTERIISKKNASYIHALSSVFPISIANGSSLSNVCNEISIRNRGACDRVLSVTNSSGFVLPEDQFTKRVASADLSNYKLVKRGQFAYNPSRINVGSIARLDDWDKGVLSPMYSVFELDLTKIDSDYFYHWLQSRHAKYRINQCAQGSVRETVSFTDFSTIEIPLPNLNKQKQIARYLNCVYQEITIIKELVEKYKFQKSFLMSKLLTGEWEAPSLRAKGVKP